MLEAQHREAVVQRIILISCFDSSVSGSCVGTPKDRDAERAYSACLRICLEQIFVSFVEISICDCNHFCMLQIQLLAPNPSLEFLLKLAGAVVWLSPIASLGFSEVIQLRVCCLGCVIPLKIPFWREGVGGEEWLSFAAAERCLLLGDVGLVALLF